MKFQSTRSNRLAVNYRVRTVHFIAGDTNGSNRWTSRYSWLLNTYSSHLYCVRHSGGMEGHNQAYRSWRYLEAVEMNGGLNADCRWSRARIALRYKLSIRCKDRQCRVPQATTRWALRRMIAGRRMAMELQVNEELSRQCVLRVMKLTI